MQCCIHNYDFYHIDSFVKIIKNVICILFEKFMDFYAETFIINDNENGDNLLSYVSKCS